ncbi:MAG: cytoskeletal protein CcmA (bactofilin family) [Chlamydiales bacterium]|jgi:cytoskeletal protein CcmA (bactofilin family)
MFKRYTKNPFEKEKSVPVFEEETGTVAVHPNHPKTFAAERKHNPTERQHTPYQAKTQEEYTQDIPPRIFRGRVQQSPNGHGPVHDEILTQQELWSEKNGKAPVPPPQQDHFEGEEPETTLGQGVVFKGQLSFENLLRIDGEFHGDLCSKGKLVIGPSGIVKSNIKLREAIIEGYVEGNLDVEERIELRGNAQVHGDIQTRFLSVDEGVTIIGSVMITPHEDLSERKATSTEKEEVSDT